MIGHDDDTLNTCPLCHGEGRQVFRSTDIDGRPHAISNECYLCGGRGAVHYHTLVMWNDAGRPQASRIE